MTDSTVAREMRLLTRNWTDIQEAEKKARRAADAQKAADDLRERALRAIDQAARYRLFRDGKISRWKALENETARLAPFGLGFSLLIMASSIFLVGAKQPDFMFFMLGFAMFFYSLLQFVVVDINDNDRNLITRAINAKVISDAAITTTTKAPAATRSTQKKSRY